MIILWKSSKATKKNFLGRLINKKWNWSIYKERQASRASEAWHYILTSHIYFFNFSKTIYWDKKSILIYSFLIKFKGSKYWVRRLLSNSKCKPHSCKLPLLDQRISKWPRSGLLLCPRDCGSEKIAELRRSEKIVKKRRRKTMIKQARLYVPIRKISLQRGEAVWPYIYREVLFIRPSLNEKKTNKGWNTIILKWLLLLLLHVPNSSPATSSCQISDHRRNCKRQISSKKHIKEHMHLFC